MDRAGDTFTIRGEIIAHVILFRMELPVSVFLKRD